MKNPVGILITALALLLNCTASAQITVVSDLCVATFGDGKVFYARVLSNNGGVARTKMVHSDALYSFQGTTVKASEGTYKPGHKCKSVAYFGDRKKDLAYAGDYIEVTFPDGAAFFARVESIGNDGMLVKMLHTGNKYKFSADGTVLSSKGLYPAGSKTRSILKLSRRK